MRTRILISTLLLLDAFSCAADAPGWHWTNATPESQGMSSAKLEAIKERLAAKNTQAFLVVRNDRIVYEWYAPGVTATTKQGTASLAKAAVGGMSLAVAITDGKISIDDPAAKFATPWKLDPLKSQITIRQLGSHTSGMADAEGEGQTHEELTGWKGDFWKRLEPPNDPFTIARDLTPVLSTPGTRLQYSNPGIGMMAYCVTASLRDSEIRDIRTLLRERVMRPIGVPDTEWSVGYGKASMVDGLPLVATWGGGAYTPRAMARIGQLVQHEGEWDGRRILSREAIRQVTTDAGLVGNCGMGWWGNGGLRYPKLPKTAVWGAGAGDQLLFVVPELNLVMVRNGSALIPGPGEPPIRNDDVFTRYHDYRARILFDPLIDAVVSKPKIPRSAFIQEIRWAPVDTIRRAAKGSDNWPMTWADDDALYMAYGDGNGFEPFTAEKLSLGLAKVSGSPSQFQGVNLRTPSLESRGDGRTASKASGMVMVNGVLYLLARNVTNAQLAWSRDHGTNWTWADWKFTESFGAPTFVNFGRDYAGARDEFVYVISADSDNAYDLADGYVVARAPKQRLHERAAWEFYAGIDNENALWTREVARRAPVLRAPGECYRPGISYDAPLQRYLLVHPVPAKKSRDAAGRIDTRFAGGLAIYEAREPWGPWSQVFHAAEWDVGPGETASFPPKWMSADGKTLHLVFSGNDSFSVRKATVVTDN